MNQGICWARVIKYEFVPQSVIRFALLSLSTFFEIFSKTRASASLSRFCSNVFF